MQLCTMAASFQYWHRECSVADVTFIDAVDGKGCLQVNDVISAIRPTTVLVTVMLANNETGIIQVFTVIATLS